MKKILTLILCLTYTSLLFSQEKNSLIIGEWRVICIQTHNYYYNSVTDSLFYYKEFKKLLPKLIKSKSFGFKNLEEFNENVKKEATNDKFIFEENGIYLRKQEGKILHEGTYRVNSRKKTISFKYENEPKYYMEYYVQEQLLYLTITSKGSFRPTKFILQKY